MPVPTPPSPPPLTPGADPPEPPTTTVAGTGGATGLALAAPSRRPVPGVAATAPPAPEAPSTWELLPATADPAGASTPTAPPAPSGAHVPARKPVRLAGRSGRSAPAAAEPAQASAPLHVRLTGQGEVAAAVGATLALAQRDVVCSDLDGSAFSLGSRACVAYIEALLRLKPGAQLLILVDDARWLEIGAPRLRLLQRHWAHVLRLRVADPADPVGDERVLIADRAHAVLLRPLATALGEHWTGNARRAGPLRNAFERRWERAAYDLPVQPLGL